MGLQVTTNINIDFYDKKYILINAKQYDKKSRYLSVTCYNHGEIFPINSSEHSAYIRYKKSDNHSVFNSCDIDRKGKIIVELTEQMLASEGICCADLVIVNKGNANVDENTGKIESIEDTSILSTMILCIDVSETAVENSEIESSYEFNGLNIALEKAEAEYSEVIRLAKSYAHGNAGGIRGNEEIDNAKYYYEQSLINSRNASNSATSASESASKASISQQYAAQYMNDASTFANNAKNSATSASESAQDALNSAGKSEISQQYAAQYMYEAITYANNAENSASSASASETNAYNYYLQAETVVNGLNGAFSPKGTVTFAELMELKNNNAIAAGDLYQISDGFTTDGNFRVYNMTCGAGTSVYYTVDGVFDVFVGATVAGVKGDNEDAYRTGMVNLTPDNIGAIPSANVATVDEVTNYLGI